jgi:CRP/FNR family transcriptional regulator, anaerobic regulatory protein
MELSALDFQMSRLYAPLTPSPQARASFIATLTEKNLRKGEHLLREGEISNSLFFIRKGLMRYYYLVDGVEHTGQFFDEGMFFADLFSMTTQAPAIQNIDALEPCEIIVIPRYALLAAYSEDHAYERFGRCLITESMMGSVKRTADLLKCTPEERYLHFIASRQNLVERIPQYIIASYLGITPEALSRIRRRIAKP